MVRSHTRTTNKAAWTEETLAAALASIKSGTSIRAAGCKYGIHEPTLRKRIKKGLLGGPNMGRKPVLTIDQEKELCSHLLRLSKLFYGVSLIELRRIAFEYAVKNKIKHNFSETNKLAGKDWAQGFMRRNPTLSIRKPEPTSLSRILGFNKCEVQRFFNNLTELYDRYKFQPHRIYNVDETGVTTVQRPPSVIAPKGQKQVGAATSLERGRNVTVCCAMSATGLFIPPMFVYPGARMSAGLSRGGPPGSVYKMSKSGWMNEEIFFEWLKHFLQHTNSTPNNPTLLLLDNHSSHTSLTAYNFCKQNGIIVLSFPPHTSHRLQPLDVSFYGLLKAAYHRECTLFMRNHPYAKINKEDIPKIFKNSFEKVAGVSKAVSGFEKTGIFPLKPDVFSDEDFVPDSEIVSQDLLIDEETMAENLDSRDPLVEVQQEAACSSRATSSINEEIPVNDDCRGNDRDDNEAGCSKMTFAQISPLPTLASSSSQHKTKNARPKQHSEVLTATPRKEILEAMEKNKKEKLEKIAAKGKKLQKSRKHTNNTLKKFRLTGSKRKLFQDSSSEEDENVDDNQLVVSSDDDVIDPAALPEIRSRINDPNDFCLFCGEFGQDKELWYRCVMCSGWVHSECSAAESATHFICDFCLEA